jgi:hypothetical protein
VGEASIEASQGTLVVAGSQDRGAFMAVKGGSAQVHLPDGSTVDLDPFRLLRLAPDGSYSIEDAPPEMFSERPDTSLPGAGSGSGSTQIASGEGRRSSNPGRYRIASPGNRGATRPPSKSHRTSSNGSSSRGKRRGNRNGVMAPGGRVRPGTVRGFRDAF